MPPKRGEGAAKPITHSTGYPNPPDTVMLAQLTVLVPMTFEKVEQLPHLTGYCQRCRAVLGKIVWVAHSTPYLKWETDSAYGEFILCESCGDKAALESASSPSALIAAVEAMSGFSVSHFPDGSIVTDKEGEYVDREDVLKLLRAAPTEEVA